MNGAVDQWMRPGSRIHMMGIGGVGMAGLAALLKYRGCVVDGCDLAASKWTAWLEAQDIRVRAGHDTEHLRDRPDLLIYSTAVARDRPEWEAARRLGIPSARRGEALAAMLNAERGIAITGAHGKTSAVSMLADILSKAGLLGARFVGGEPGGGEGPSGTADGPWFAAEADESDGTLRRYRPVIGVVTNADRDHLEHYRDEDDLWDCYRDFAAHTERLVYCADDDRSRALFEDCGHTLTFGLSPKADSRAVDLDLKPGAASYTWIWRGTEAGRICLPMTGGYPVLNALAASAAAMEAGADAETVCAALAEHRPVRRRFETVADSGRRKAISDYAHHPAEIRALMSAAERLGVRPMVVVFQPHRYTRTRRMKAEFPPAFRGADRVILCPVFAASEPPLEGGTEQDVLAEFENSGWTNVEISASLEAAWRRAQTLMDDGGLLLIVGAGDVEKMGDWARDQWTRNDE